VSVTLLVTSYNRQAELERFFRSIADQTFAAKIEVIFVNQNLVRPGSCDILSAPIRLTVLQTGGRTSLSKARNIGISKCLGDVIACPDDDCWYEPKLLERVADYFQNNPGVDCICTNVFDPDRNVSFGRRPVGVTCTVSFSNVFKLGISVGIFVRREALARAGAYFDEGLGAGTDIGSGEETELLARLLSAGCRIEYVGYLQVYHPVTEYSRGDIHKSYRYCLGFGHLNWRLLRAGHLGVLWGFAEILTRSIAGVVVNIRSPIRRAVYWNRLTGALAGFVDAAAHSGLCER
jgi:glycosyltransferase involved in cell wall biosynthesis